MHRTAQRIRAGQSERAARLTICGTDWKSDFDELHSGANDASVFLYGFDLIELDGEDLRPAALADRVGRPVAVEYPGYPVVRLRRIEGIEFVLEAVAALGSSTELATHLFRECWAVGTGSEADDLRHGREVRFRRAAFGCE